MMTVYEYASDMNKTVEEILQLCQKLGISASGQDDELSDDDIILLDNEIENYLDSIGETDNIQKVQTKEKIKSRDVIISLLKKDGTLNTASLASQIGITTKAVEKHLSKLKSEGIIERIGSNKTGYWKVNKL